MEEDAKDSVPNECLGKVKNTPQKAVDVAAEYV